jgi:hypothetical protein
MSARFPSRVSDNWRFLLCGDGRPFFYLGDTAWELFHRLDREETETYLQDRARKGFTVIQAVVLAELDGLREPNRYGYLPLHDLDPTRPNEAYFEHVDWVIKRANELGLCIALLPTWGDKWNQKWGVGSEIFTPENSAIYGEWLGRRYRDAGLIWVVGGDRPIETDEHRAIVSHMAEGLRRGDGGQHLITFHPSGMATSATWFHAASWLDFNMWQTGHARERPNYGHIAADYALEPVKPCLDGEPGYEAIPADFKLENGLLQAIEVRRWLYWALFAGAHGHTYGANSVWQFWQPGREPQVSASLPWQDALQLPGAAQMQHARRLLESRPFLTRVPDQSLIVAGQSDGPAHLQATRDQEGSYALVYFGSQTAASIDMGVISGAQVHAHWFNPRTGKAQLIGEFAAEGTREFVPPATEYPEDDFPSPEPENDWVLVLDDARFYYNSPGQGVHPLF